MFFFGFNISLILFIKRIGQFINHIITVYFVNYMLIYKFNPLFHNVTRESHRLKLVITRKINQFFLKNKL